MHNFAFLLGNDVVGVEYSPTMLRRGVLTGPRYGGVFVKRHATLQRLGSTGKFISGTCTSDHSLLGPLALGILCAKLVKTSI